MRNKSTDLNSRINQPLEVSVNTQNPSFVSNALSKQSKKSYVQYIAKFDHDIQYTSSTTTQIQNSLNEMRIIVREFNVMLNKMMDKNYQYLAERQNYQITPQKQIQLLQAQIQNAKKLVSNQDSQITTLSNTIYEMENKQQSYQQRLIDQILEVRDKLPGVYLESKHSACDINRNGYVLVNQDQDNSLYARVNILRGDLERAYERLKRAEEKQKQISEKERELEQKNYQISQRFNKCVQNARENAMEITSNGTIISFRQKYSILYKKKQQEMKKNSLLEHVSKNNQVAIQKKILDMKRLLNEYNSKQQELNKRIQEIEKQTESVLKKSNVLQKFTQKSFSLRYAETLLKGDKSFDKQRGKPDQQLDDYQDDFQDFSLNKSSVKVKKTKIHQQQKSVPLKPSLNLIRKKNQYGQNRYEKSLSLVEIAPKRKQQNNLNLQQNKYEGKSIFNIRRSSANQSKKMENKELESPNLKIWKKQKGENQNNQESILGNGKEYRVSKPMLNMKRKIENVSTGEVREKQSSKKNINLSQSIEQSTIKPKFSRLTNKKNSTKMTDQYMTYLQEKGRKLLGLS